MSVLAATVDIGTHPASALLLGGLFTAFLRGRYASFVLILAPLFGLGYLTTLEIGGSSSLHLFGYEILAVMVDQQAMLFGYLFHTAALIAGIYSFHVRDPWQVSMALLYAGSAVGVAFAGDLLSLFLWWEALAITSVFQIWGRRTQRAEDAGFRYLFFHISSGLLLLIGILFRYHELGIDALSLQPLTDALEAGDTGALFILLAIGIKAAFPGLHVWLKDGYAEATHSGPVWLCAFTTKCAVCMLARLYPGADILITIGIIMALFPLFYAVIENDLRRVLCYSKINQIGFMVVAIGIGTELAIDGAIAHAFNHVLYKSLLFMCLGAVIFRTGEIRASHLGGLYKKMPWTTGFCIVGSIAISFPLFCGFVSKSIIITEAAKNGYQFVWIVLLFASAGVFHQAGIKIPYFTFFSKDQGIQAKEAPVNMLLAMGLGSFLCIFIGCNPQWLYDLLPNGAKGFNPYDATHVITQLQILAFSGLAFLLMMILGKYPTPSPSINLDIDWVYRKCGRGFLYFGDWFWNGFNDWAHRFFVGSLTDRICLFLKQGHVYAMRAFYGPLCKIGLIENQGPSGPANLAKRTSLGIHPVGWTALCCIVFFLGFLCLAFF